MTAFCCAFDFPLAADRSYNWNPNVLTFVAHAIPRQTPSQSLSIAFGKYPQKQALV
jgi:hypothetical protein